MLVGFGVEEITHFILIGPKAATGWANKQTLSKAERLQRIFGRDGARYFRVEPHFELISPHPPRQLESDLWPAWMTKHGQPIWFELTVPTGRRRVTRCDSVGRQT